ncbi:MAG: type II secretion system F family protein [Armatimonadetes bacterium]|nr:type II secretion system F family protein [Armatimonadota bacterium]
MIKQQLDKAKFLLESGETLSDSLKCVDIFPDLMLDMIAVGIQTGELSFTLEKVSNFYSLDLEYILEQFTALLEPIVITILGVVIGFIVLGIFLPIYSMLKM